ncbi:hypothetical protein DMENIID0001_023600 [Sergentomyia squamirostris]
MFFFKDTALDLYNKIKKKTGILSYICDLDLAMPCGIPTGHLTEVVGLPGSGRTAFCIKACIAASMPKSVLGFDGESMYLDIRQQFSPELLETVVNSSNRDAESNGNMFQRKLEDVWETIFYAKITNMEDFVSRVETMDHFLTDHPKVRLIVVDSLIGLSYNFTSNYYRVKFLCEMLHRLEELALKQQLAVIIVNDMTTKYNVDDDDFKIVPSLGPYYSHKFFLQLILSRSDDERIIVEVSENIRNTKQRAVIDID